MAAILTPADQGIVAATLDDCLGLGDDDQVDAITSALVLEAGFSLTEAQDLAYRSVHRNR